MPYATADDVREVLSNPDQDVTGTPGELSDTVLDDRVATAQATVDAYLTERYTVPFVDSEVPKLVEDCTIAIAAYLAALTYRKSLDLPATDPAALRYAWALGTLKSLNTGEMSLPPTGPSGDPTPRAGTAYGRNTVGYSGNLFALDQFGLEPAYGPRKSPPYYDPEGW